MFDTDITHFQSVSVHNFFVKPAHYNYFLARFSRVNSLIEEFHWHSQQALEKLLKAGLVLNGVSVKRGFGHDLIKLWDKHLEVFGDLAVTSIERPRALAEVCWREEPLRKTISDINKLGNPNSRYGQISAISEEDDLFKLDQLVFEFGRRTFGRNWIVSQHWQDNDLLDFTGQTYGSVLRQSDSLPSRAIQLPRGHLTFSSGNIENVLTALNFAFPGRDSETASAPDGSLASPLGSAARNSLLFQLDEALQNGPYKSAKERIKWLLSNIKLDRDVETHLTSRLANQP